MSHKSLLGSTPKSADAERLGIPERKKVNAVISANTLKWRESSAFNENFQLDCLDVDNVLRFNAKAIFDDEFKQDLKGDMAATLKKFGFSDLDVAALDAGWEERLQLTEDEYQSIDELTTRLHGQGVKGQMALERSTSSQGVGVPAIALLIVVVAVIVFVIGVKSPGSGAQ